MTLASGNEIALEDELSFNIGLSVCYSSFNDLTVIVLSSAHIVIEDLDGEPINLKLSSSIMSRLSYQNII